MLVPSRKVMPSVMSCCWTRSSRRSQTPCFAQRMKSCAASHHGPNSAGMLRHFAPFWCRQKIAEIVRRNSFGGVLPRGRTVRSAAPKPPMPRPSKSHIHAYLPSPKYRYSNQALTGLSTTVAFLTRGSDLLPGGWERMDERRVDRGDRGALGRIVAGGEGADAPVVHAGTGGGLGGSVSGWAAWGGAAQDGLDARRGGG